VLRNLHNFLRNGANRLELLSLVGLVWSCHAPIDIIATLNGQSFTHTCALLGVLLDEQSEDDNKDFHQRSFFTDSHATPIARRVAGDLRNASPQLAFLSIHGTYLRDVQQLVHGYELNELESFAYVCHTIEHRIVSFMIHVCELVYDSGPCVNIFDGFQLPRNDLDAKYVEEMILRDLEHFKATKPDVFPTASSLSCDVDVDEIMEVDKLPLCWQLS